MTADIICRTGRVWRVWKKPQPKRKEEEDDEMGVSSHKRLLKTIPKMSDELSEKTANDADAVDVGAARSPRRTQEKPRHGAAHVVNLRSAANANICQIKLLGNNNDYYDYPRIKDEYSGGSTVIVRR